MNSVSTFRFFATLLPFSLVLLSCSGPKGDRSAETVTDTAEVAAPAADQRAIYGNPTEPPRPMLSEEYTGIFHGIQPAYFLKNRFGDDMVINGRKVPVPAIDHKFLVKDNGEVALQQTSLEDNSRVYYDGTYRILESQDGYVKLECTLSDGNSSSPVYILKINAAEQTALCSGTSQPDFTLQKSGSNSGNTETQSEPAQVQNNNGMYAFRDNSVEIVVTVSSDAWRARTRIISGFGDDYDDQNAEYEGGPVSGNDLFDETGSVRIGYIKGNRLTTSIGGQTVVLEKR